jgi:twinkle protein
MTALDVAVRRQTIDRSQLLPYLEDQAAADIKPAGAFADELASLLWSRESDGDLLPWAKTHGDFRLRPGEVTLWHGINGHGKSAVTSQVALWLGLRGRKSCLASFEMAPARTLRRMLFQCAGNSDPAASFFTDFLVFLTSRIYVFDKRGRVDAKVLIAAIRYCAREKGVSHFFVDSLMKCIPRQDDYDGQSDLVNSLCDVAHETGVHVHLVHHNRKGDNEDAMPNKFDAKGSGAITDQVDNVIAVWKNKKKFREIAKAREMGADPNVEGPDFVLINDKQRNGDRESMWGLWGDERSYHFRDQERGNWQRGYEIPQQAEPGALG